MIRAPIILLATSLIAVLDGGEGPIKPPAMPTEMFNHADKIDYVRADPLQSGTRISNFIIKTSFSRKLNTQATVTITIYNDNFPKGKVITTLSTLETEATLSYRYNQLYNGTSTSTNKLIFTLQSQYGNDYVYINVMKGEYQSIYPRNLKETLETPENIAVYRYQQGVTYVSEKFQLSNLQTNIYLSKLKPYSVNNFTIRYTRDDDFDFCADAPQLFIKPANNTFTHFGEPFYDNQWRKINLHFNCASQSKSITMGFDNKFYIHPITMDLSTYPIEGYVETKQMYFPSYLKEGTLYKMWYVFENFGSNAYSFSFQFNLHINRRMLGNCTDSSYCVSIENAEPDVELGTQINH